MLVGQYCRPSPAGGIGTGAVWAVRFVQQRYVVSVAGGLANIVCRSRISG
jgi:hypothetical protein